MDFTFHSNGKPSGTLWSINDCGHNMPFSCSNLKEKHVAFALSSCICEWMLQTIPVDLLMYWCDLYECLYIMDLFCCFCRTYLWIYSQRKRFQFYFSDLIIFELFLWSAMMRVVFYLTNHSLQTNEKPLRHYRKPYGNYCSLHLSVQIIFLLIPWNAKSSIFVLSFGWNAATKVLVTVMIHGGLKFNQQWINISTSGSVSDHVPCVCSLEFVKWANSL